MIYLTNIKIKTPVWCQKCGGALRFECVSDTIDLRCARCHETTMSIDVHNDDKTGGWHDY